jgi:hypothetical protein
LLMNVQQHDVGRLFVLDNVDDLSSQCNAIQIGLLD